VDLGHATVDLGLRYCGPRYRADDVWVVLQASFFALRHFAHVCQASCACIP
jgi:hypothetical protein